MGWINCGNETLPLGRNTMDGIPAAAQYAAKAADVTDMIVNGRVLMRDRRLLTIKEAAAKAQARRYRRQVSDSLKSDER